MNTITAGGVSGSVLTAPAAPSLYGGTNGALTVTFSATRFDVNSDLSLGAGSALVFSGGAPTTTAGAGYLRIGNESSATLTIAGGSITINGDNGSNPGRIWVGANSDSGQAASGTLVMTSGSLTFNDGPGGADYGGLAIGRDGGVTGVFNQSGGTVTFNGTSAIDIGTQGGTGSYNLSGTASFLSTSGATIYVGSRTNEGAGVGTVSSGTLTISDAASFIVQSGTQLYVGDAKASGTITQSGTSTVSITTSNPILFGGNVSNAGGASGGGTGTYNLQGGTLTLGGNKVILGAAAGGTGIFNVSGGSASFLNGVQLASTDATGTFTQTGGSVSIDGGLVFGGSNATYTLSGGTLTVDGISGSGGANAQFLFSGGTLVADGSFSTSSGFATLVTAASTIGVDGSDTLTWNSALSGSGDLAKTGTGTLALGADNSGFTGDVEVQGGTLAVKNVNGLTAANDVALASGTTLDISAANASSFGTVQIGALSGSGTVDVGNNSLVVNIGAGETSAFSGTFTADKHSWQSSNTESSLVKAGAGALVIDGMTATAGNIYVVEGALQQTSGTTTLTYLAVGSGAQAVAGNNAALTVSGGTLNIGESLQVGDWGGTGSVTQTGGTVKIQATCDTPANCGSFNIGNQGGTGTYSISGGSLVVVGGLSSIGRNTSQNGGSGTLNIDGGLVELQYSADNFGPGGIVIGDRGTGSASTNASGTVNQTAGIFRINANTNLYLGGYGAGTYNLNGGTLEIGGTSLNGLYGGGGGTGSYDFNLGGGTIKVIGSALTTSVNAELTGSSVSTFDTNGLGATWAGTLSGTGSLRKTGEGELSLTNGANSYTGSTYLAGGTLRAVSGAIGSGALIFEASSTLAFAGSFSLDNAVTLGAGTTAGFDVGSGLTGTLSGDISGAGGLTKTGLGTLVLSGTDNTYSGATYVDAGTLRIIGEGALSDTTVLTVATGAVLDLQGVQQSVESLEGGGSVSIGAGSTLTVDDTGGSSTFSGTLSGDGGLDKSGTGQLILTGINTYTGPTGVTSGTLTVNGSIANSPVTIDEGGTLGGSGTVGSITLTAGGILAPGNSPGTLTSINDVDFAAGSYFDVEVEGTVSDKVLVTSGNATIQDGAVLRLSVASDITLSSPYTIVETATGSVTKYGDGFTVIDGKPLLDSSVGYFGQSVTVTFSAVTTPWSNAVSTGNQGATANAVQSLGGGNALYHAAVFVDDDQINRAFDLLSGEVNASAKGVLITDSQFLRGAVLDRLANAGKPGVSSGMKVAPLAYAAPGGSVIPVKAAPAPAEPRSAVWAQGFGAWGTTGATANAAALDRTVGGVFVGADTLFDATPAGAWRVGFVTGYSQTSFNVDDRASSGSADTAHIGAYAGTNWGAVNLRAGAAYSWNDVSTSRFATLPTAQTLKADYTAGTAQVFGELGYGLAAGGFDFEPFAGIAYVNLSTDGFTESGGAAALSSGSESTGVTYTTLGLRGVMQFASGSTTSILKGMVGWRHAFGDVTPLATYTFAAGGTPFTVEGLPIAEDALLLDLGADLFITRTVSFGVAYNGQFGDSVTDQALRGTLDWRF